jgi:hypothetical protein
MPRAVSAIYVVAVTCTDTAVDVVAVTTVHGTTVTVLCPVVMQGEQRVHHVVLSNV